MSKLLKKHFQSKHNIPRHKIMGDVSAVTVSKIVELVYQGKNDNIVHIVDNIKEVLGTDVSHLNADEFHEKFEGEWQQRLEYDDPVVSFFVVAKGTMEIELMNEEPINVPIGSVFFVDERETFRIVSPHQQPLVVLSGKFIWDKNTHA